MNIVVDFHNFFFNLFYTNFKLFNYQFDEDKKEIHLFLEPKDNYPQCPICKNHNVVVHEYRHRIVKDGSYNGFQFILHITYRTFKCKFCDKYATEQIPFISSRHRITKSLENEVIEDLQRSGSIKDTAQRTSLKWDTCKQIHKDYLKRNTPFFLGKAKHLAIDEFSIKKGHKYATVVVDLDTKRVIWVGKGKTVREVNRFFKLCGTEGCKQIKAVAMDQNAGFATCVNKYCPNAKVVYDLFHMVYNFGRLVISAIRLRLAYENKNKNDDNAYSLLKRSRFLLLTKNSNLSEEKRIKLNDILSFYHDLYAANELKELLPEVFHAHSKEESESLWDEWVRLALQSKVQEITKFAKVQNRRYRDGITNSGIYRIRTSVLEGINNKIKVLKRLAYGFRDLEYFFLRIRDAFRGNAYV